MRASSLVRLFQRVLILAGLLLQAGQAAAIPESGTWWNPNESGRGFFIEAREGMLFVAGYIYDAAGRPTWVSSGGALPDPYRYEGTLVSYRNGQSMFGTYRSPDPAVVIGPVTLTFEDDRRATIAWPGVTIPLERLTYGEDEPQTPASFALLPVPFKPQTGWWWNPDESGTGYTIEVQGSTASIGAFMYDDAGNPTWYVSAGPMTSPTRYEGDWLEYTGGQALGAPYRAPTARSVGRVTVEFESEEAATLTFSDIGAPVATQRASPATTRPPRTTRAQTLQARRASRYPATYRGGFEVTKTWVGVDTSVADQDAYRFDTQWNFHSLWRTPNGYDIAEYRLDRLSSDGLFRRTWSDTETDCYINHVVPIGGIDGSLLVRSDGKFEFLLAPAADDWSVELMENCPDTDHGRRLSPQSYVLANDFRIFDREFRAAPTVHPVLVSLTRTWDDDFLTKTSLLLYPVGPPR